MDYRPIGALPSSRLWIRKDHLHVAAYNGHAGAIIAMLGGLLPEHHLAAMMVPNMFRRTPLHERHIMAA
jgi:hypothetical protein